MPTQGSGTDFLEVRRAALLSAVANSAKLKTGLKSMLHEQRDHKRLISTGWVDEFEIPLNIYILGDVKDPWTSGVLLPLGAILNGVLATTKLCRTQWLLNIAVFPESAPDQDLMAWSFLQALDDFLQPESKEREKLTKALKMEPDQSPDFSVFLFDSRKEGDALVKDQASLDILMGNALLALLQEDLAGVLFNKRDMTAMLDRHSYYGSMGSSALIYDPDALQIACARRSGYNFLQDKILCKAHDGQAALQKTNQIQEKIGGIYAWMERVCSQLSPVIGQVSIKSDLSEIIPQFTDLSMPVLDYERINQTPWADKLREYDANFRQVTLPAICAQLLSNKNNLKTILDGFLKEVFDQLPLETGLYPGGLENNKRVLELLADGFITDWF